MGEDLHYALKENIKARLVDNVGLNFKVSVESCKFVQDLHKVYLVYIRNVFSFKSEVECKDYIKKIDELFVIGRQIDNFYMIDKWACINKSFEGYDFVYRFDCVLKKGSILLDKDITKALLQELNKLVRVLEIPSSEYFLIIKDEGEKGGNIEKENRVIDVFTYPHETSLVKCSDKGLTITKDSRVETQEEIYNILSDLFRLVGLSNYPILRIDYTIKELFNEYVKVGRKNIAWIDKEKCVLSIKRG